MTTIIHVNQYNTGKQNLEKKIGDFDGKIPGVSGLVTATVLNTKISEEQNKIPDVGGLVNKTDSHAKISDIEKKYLTTYDYNKFT